MVDMNNSKGSKDLITDFYYSKGMYTESLVV